MYALKEGLVRLILSTTLNIMVVGLAYVLGMYITVLTPLVIVLTTQLLRTVKSVHLVQIVLVINPHQLSQPLSQSQAGK
jgi:hypothetical protein